MTSLSVIEGDHHMETQVPYLEDPAQKPADIFTGRKGPKKRSRGKLQRHNIGASFEHTAFDILKPLPRTADVNRYILVVIHYFTSWPEAYPIPDPQ
ncbi:hypothetical protein X975_15686, partial [Stegodyphus mimosarum]